ncbi:MAG: hypothetical protein HYU99_06140 [Deltaproteobacteria bacterium]|nr:hypothetical protein [Deltaproteobacteria bacterium]
MSQPSLGVFLSENTDLYREFLDANQLDDRPVDAVTLRAAAFRTARRPGVSDSLKEFSRGVISAYSAGPNPGQALIDLTGKTEPTDSGILTRPLPDPNRAFVEKYGGSEDRVIYRVLIANNGMAAERIVLALRGWAGKYLGNRRAIHIIAMATKEDRELGLRYIEEADTLIPLDHPATRDPDYPHNQANYANVDLIRLLAKEYGADVVHPGWGHASEEKALAQAMEEEGIIFMGPRSGPMQTLGDKIRSMVFYQTLNGEETMAPWSGSGLRVPEDGMITRDLVEKARVSTLEEALEAAEKVGYPVYLKAAGVGGGRGMKECFTPEEVKKHWKTVSAGSAGSDIFVMWSAKQKHPVNDLNGALSIADRLGYPVFLKTGKKGEQIANADELRRVAGAALQESSFEDLLGEVTDHGDGLSPAPVDSQVYLLGGGLKHIEVQVVADEHGNTIVLWPRDCSIQYEHQKMIEESAYISPEIAQKLMRSAVALATKMRYNSLGTVEFLVDPDDNRIVFLEMNTRVQVEHPVTEGVTDLDLIEMQMFISQGVPLHRIPQVRRYFGVSEKETTPIPFENLMYDKGPEGHEIALRITAKDPDNKLINSAGKIQTVEFQGMRGVWFYSSVSAGGGMGTRSDSQIGHLFVHAKTREEARQKALVALDKVDIFGDLKTNIPSLQALLLQPDYISGNVHNATLDRWVDEGTIKVEKPPVELTAVVSALIQAARGFEKSRKDFEDSVERGQTPNPNPDLYLYFKSSIPVMAVVQGQKFEFTATQGASGAIVLENKNNPASFVEGRVEVGVSSDFTVTIDRRYYVDVADKEDAQKVKIRYFGTDNVGLVENDPARFKSNMPGVVGRVTVKPGQTVRAGDELMMVEAMKSENSLCATRDGVIKSVNFGKGQEVKEGQVVVEFEQEAGRPAGDKPFVEPFTLFPPPAWTQAGAMPETTAGALLNILGGYAYPVDLPVEEYLVSFLDDLGMQRTWGQDFEIFLSAYRKGMPEGLYDELIGYARSLQQRIGQDRAVRAVPSAYEKRIRALVGRQKYGDEFARKKDVYQKFDFLKALDRYLAEPAIRTPELVAAQNFIRRYTDDEKYFADRNIANPLEHLKGLKASLGASKIVDICRSHRTLAIKNRIILAILTNLSQWGIVPAALSPELKELAHFSGDNYTEVAARARSLLLGGDGSLSPKARRRALAGELRHISKLPTPQERYAAMERLANRPKSLFTDLVPLVFQDDEVVRRYAAILYTLRTYREYPLRTVRSPEPLLADPVSFAYRYRSETGYTRFGQVAVARSVKEFARVLPKILDNYEQELGHAKGKKGFEALKSGNFTLTLLLHLNGKAANQNDQAASINKILSTQGERLTQIGIKRVTVQTIGVAGEYPFPYTFKVGADGTVTEDKVYRGIEPPLAFQLDFERLKNFELTPVSSVSKEIVIFHAAARDPRADDTRFFVRSVVRDISVDQATGKYPEIDNRLSLSMENLGVAMSDQNGLGKSNWNEIYLNVYPPFAAHSVEDIRQYLESLMRGQKNRLNDLLVFRVEIDFSILDGEGREQHYLMVFRNHPHTRYEVEVLAKDRLPDGQVMVSPLGQPENRAALHPYRILTAIDKRRQAASVRGTTYVYDWPNLFEEVLEEEWKGTEDRPQGKLLNKRELYLSPDGRLIEDTFGKRPIGVNINEKNKDDPQNNGAVAFRLTLKTREYPEGRDIMVAVMNDVNWKGGSFGPREAALYKAVAQRAIDEGIPFIAIQANTGARFQLEAEVVKRFKPAYSLQDPQKGFATNNVVFEYLYLTESDYEALKNQVICEKMVVDGETRYKILVIPGITEGLDADSLRGSGHIAGISDEAYDKIFTASLVSGYMAVGIGSYLGHLLHRVIQNGPMVLTGYKALNALLGVQKYLSEEQLAGKQIMIPNGVAYWGVGDDLQAVELLLRQLSFVPLNNRALPPVLATDDPSNRPLKRPTADEIKGDPHFIPREFFDRGSFVPALDLFMDGYGRVVQTGRGRLAGRSVGFVNIDPREHKREIPPDPAEETTATREEKQYPRVLFPDSSYKLAEAVDDFNRSGLATIIFINLRGFSGGTRDMFNEILKYGSMIVTAIRKAKKPVYVYFPFNAELRGGAWVVFDKAINGEGRVRMYADTTARGGVLEAKGSVEVHGKKVIKDKLRIMASVERLTREIDSARKKGDEQAVIRLSKQLREAQDLRVQFPGMEGLYGTNGLYEELAAAEKQGDKARVKELKAQIEDIEKVFSALYHQALVEMADLQHRVSAMKQRGVIDDEVAWEKAREYLHVVMEKDLEVGDFEREVRELYPTIRTRELRKLLDEYANAVETNHAKNGSFRDEKARAGLLGRAAQMKAVRYGREAFEADPAGALKSGLRELVRQAEYAGTNLPEEAQRGIEALLTGAATLPDVPSRVALYQKMVPVLAEMGLWRTDDSDEDNPVFYDAQGNEFSAEIAREGELIVTLQKGDVPTILEHWGSILTQPSVFRSAMVGGLVGVILEAADGSTLYSVSALGEHEETGTFREASPVEVVDRAPAQEEESLDHMVYRQGLGDMGNAESERQMNEFADASLGVLPKDANPAAAPAEAPPDSKGTSGPGGTGNKSLMLPFILAGLARERAWDPEKFFAPRVEVGEHRLGSDNSPQGGVMSLGINSPLLPPMAGVTAYFSPATVSAATFAGIATFVGVTATPTVVTGTFVPTPAPMPVW